jgi:hypothetical protein
MLTWDIIPVPHISNLHNRSDSAMMHLKPWFAIGTTELINFNEQYIYKLRRHSGFVCWSRDGHTFKATLGKGKPVYSTKVI